MNISKLLCSIGLHHDCSTTSRLKYPKCKVKLKWRTLEEKTKCNHCGKLIFKRYSLHKSRKRT